MQGCPSFPEIVRRRELVHYPGVSNGQKMGSFVGTNHDTSSRNVVLQLEDYFLMIEITTHASLVQATASRKQRGHEGGGGVASLLGYAAHSQ